MAWAPSLGAVWMKRSASVLGAIGQGRSLHLHLLAANLYHLLPPPDTRNVDRPGEIC